MNVLTNKKLIVSFRAQIRCHRWALQNLNGSNWTPDLGIFPKRFCTANLDKWLIFSHTKGKQLYRMLIVSFCYPNKQNGNSSKPSACLSERNSIQIVWTNRLNEWFKGSFSNFRSWISVLLKESTEWWLTQEESCLSPPNGVTSCKIERVNTDKQTILRYKCKKKKK